MTGIKYLLDTNIILGILKSNPVVTALISERSMLVNECACSAITRMELLGYPGITDAEDALIRKKLESLTLLSLTLPIEDVAIEFRRSRKVKLPDAIIVATAKYYNIELITLDQQLMTMISEKTAT